MTAVEYLEKKLDDALCDTDYITWQLVCKAVREAKEMEKQQQDEFAIGFAEWLFNIDKEALKKQLNHFKEEISNEQ